MKVDNVKFILCSCYLCKSWTLRSYVNNYSSNFNRTSEKVHKRDSTRQLIFG